MLPTKQCSGCTACYEICAKKCIEMKSDKNGFLYPFIQNEKCTNCHICEKVCPVLNNQNLVERNSEICDTVFPVGYAVYNKDEHLRLNSSSGGVFSALAEEILSKDGIVFGATFTDNLEVEHIAVNCKEELYKLRGSKYIQSNVTDCFKDVKLKLKQGRLVMFSGTPCQVEGLLAFLKKNYENLVTVDFICHGVPSIKVWKEYLKNLEKKYESKAVSANFRDKSLGWKEFSMKIEFSNGEIYSNSLHNDSYMKAFLQNLCLRESCYDCSFKKVQHKSDLTIADLWGIKDVAPNLDDDKGTSLVLVQSSTGLEMLNKIRQKVFCEEVDAKVAVAHNSAMIKSVYKNNFYYYFFKKLDKKDFEKLVHDCSNPSYLVRLKRKLFRF